MHRPRLDPRTLVAALMVAAALVGCTSGPRKISPPLEVPGGFSASGEGQVPQRWWTVFGHADLNALVARALESNFNLRTAWGRLREARAVVEREAAPLYPQIEGIADGEVRRTDSTREERLQLGLTATYEVDLWGRIRSGVEAERHRARASLQDYRTAALSLSAEIARTWVRLLEAGAQLDLLDRQIETNEKVLKLLRARLATGQTPAVDVLRQRQLVKATREERIVVESRLQVLRHQLAVLVGRPPQAEIDYEKDSLPEVPPLPETGLPVELVRRRPDVRSAFNRLRAADRELAAAISEQYPRLTLSASLTTTGDAAETLFDNWVRSFTGELVAPLFEGGRLRAEVDRTEAVKNQRLYEYGQTILSAFQEVEDALIQEKKQIERIGNIREQVRIADRAYEQLRLQYSNGAADFIDVLTELTDLQQLRRDLLSARLGLLEFRIALYRALAGGFETERERANEE